MMAVVGAVTVMGRLEGNVGRHVGVRLLFRGCWRHRDGNHGWGLLRCS
jgi:hypothetical protein